MKCKISKMLFVALALGLSVSGYSQTAEERAKIVAGFDNYEEVEAFAKQKAEEFKEGYEKAIAIAKEKGLPISGVDAGGNFFQLVGIVKETGELKYYQTTNNNPTNGSIQTARAQYLSEGGGLDLNIQGQGMAVGIWDGGQPRASHVSLGVDRVLNGDIGSSAEMTDGGILHATHVSGTMVSSGVDNSTKGFAPMAELWAHNWLNDISEMTVQSNQGLLVSNHSYGIVYGSAGFHNNPSDLGRYNTDARTLDELLYLRPQYLAVYAAGNDRAGGYAGNQWVYFNASKAGNDLLYGEAVSKNNVVVAAVEGIGEYNEASDVVMSSFSNWGPTDDYRIKPDISAKGVNVKSLGDSSNTATWTDSGTSMAAPAVTGVFVLWQQLHKQLFAFSKGKNFMNAATLKALMAATADPAGTYRNGNPPTGSWQMSTEGPDHRFGWGLINARKGAEVMQWVKSGETNAVLEELTLNNGEEYTYSFVVSDEVSEENSNPIVVAISWTDPAGSIGAGGDSDIPVLVNDLDLRLIRPNGQEVFPWKLNKNWIDLGAVKGDNDVDTIEKIEYTNAFYGHPEPGVYTIKVTHKGNLTNGSQDFSLVAYNSALPVSSKDFKFAGVELYPNPVSDILTLKDSQGSLMGANVKIHDLQGKTLFLESNYNGGSVSAIDMSNFSSGMYIIEISNNGKTQIEKIVKK